MSPDTENNARDPMIGKLIAGRYKIRAVIGEGGMGTVYKAWHVHLEDHFALKIVRPELLSEPNYLERFRREAKNARRVKHPNAIYIHDFGKTRTGLLYLVMEYIEGQDLRDLIEENPTGLDPLTVRPIVRQVCSALSEVHHCDILHRDLKPANVMLRLGDDGNLRATLLDFGLAVSADDGRLTRSDNIVGSARYVSPEQARGEKLDERSDIYSLALLIYYLLCGVLPFESETADGYLYKHVHEAPPPLRRRNPSVPRRVERVVLRALEKDPRRRQRTMTQLAEEFDAAASYRRRPLHRSPLFFSTMLVILLAMAFYWLPWKNILQQHLPANRPVAYLEARATGDSLYRNDFSAALRHYQSALEIRPEDPYSLERIDICRSRILAHPSARQ